MRILDSPPQHYCQARADEPLLYAARHPVAVVYSGLARRSADDSEVAKTTTARVFPVRRRPLALVGALFGAFDWFMPTQLTRPRPRKPRLALSVLERYKVLREACSLSSYVPVLLALSHAPAASVGQRARSRALVLLLLSMLAGAQLLMTLPRQHQASTIYPR